MSSEMKGLLLFLIYENNYKYEDLDKTNVIDHFRRVSDESDEEIFEFIRGLKLKNTK